MLQKSFDSFWDSFDRLVEGKKPSANKGEFRKLHLVVVSDLAEMYPEVVKSLGLSSDAEDAKSMKYSPMERLERKLIKARKAEKQFMLDAWRLVANA